MRWAQNFIPRLLALTIFFSGAILLFSGSVPSDLARLHWIQRFVPLPLIEISHFLGSLVGVILLFLAWGLMQRLDSAYFMTLALLVIGAVFSLLKGFNYEEASILGLMFFAVLPTRECFFRKGSLIKERMTRGWVFLIALVLVSSVCVGVFSYKNIVYSDDLWWKFEISDDASRFLRATVGTAIFILLLSLAKLIQPASPKFIIPSLQDFKKASEIISRSPVCRACLGLLGDKNFLFNKKQNAFLMYRIHGKSWVALGDPIGPKEEWKELAWEFRRLSDLYNGTMAFHEISREDLPLYLDLGLTLLKVGEEARVPLAAFSMDDPFYKEFRNTQKKVEEKGYFFEVIPADQVPPILPGLKKISTLWLKSRNTREKGFSLGFFDESYLKHFSIGVVRDERSIFAFANILESADKDEYSSDLIRYIPQESPKGIMDYLLAHLISRAKVQGYRWFNMGMAPLSGLENRQYAPFWNRLGAFLYSHGENFYNFRGLRFYKEKFRPVWEPKYLALPSSFALPRVLSDIAALNSRGVKGIFIK